MPKTRKSKSTPVPKSKDLIISTFVAFKTLGDHLDAKSIYDFVIEELYLDDQILAIKQVNKDESELWYNLRWSRTDMKKAKILIRNKQNDWSLSPIYHEIPMLDIDDVQRVFRMKQLKKEQVPETFTVGVNLKCILRILDIPPQHLADKLSVTVGSVRSWMNMKSVLPIQYISPICEILHISPHYLLTGDSTKTELYGDEADLIQSFRKLSDIGKGKVLERAKMLALDE